jgi:5-methylcytosine-specific restriction endonuclease McrA
MMRLLLATLLAATLRPGVRYRDRRWRFIAATRRHIDGHRCTRCHGYGSVLDVHHRRAVQDGGGYMLWNLQTLCRGCHERQHGRSL